MKSRFDLHEITLKFHRHPGENDQGHSLRSPRKSQQKMQTFLDHPKILTENAMFHRFYGSLRGRIQDCNWNSVQPSAVWDNSKLATRAKLAIHEVQLVGLAQEV